MVDNYFVLLRLLGKGFSKKVMMGDFLDIMCPHTGLTGTVTPNSTVTFNVYQVNEDDFNNCRITGKVLTINLF